MLRKRTAAALIALSLLTIGVLVAGGWMIAGSPQSKPGGLTGWTIIRTPDGLRLDVPVAWPVGVDPAGTTFASSDEALSSPDSVLPFQSFRALVVFGSLEELPLPDGVDRSDVAAALAGDEGHRGVSFRGATPGGQAILVVKEVAPDRYAGVFASAAPSLTFPHRREFEEIVGRARYQAVVAGGSADRLAFWLEHVQDVRPSEQRPRLWYDLLVPEGEAPASGWPVLVLAHANTSDYASIAQDGLALLVTPHFTWNTFEEDRQILDGILDEVAARYSVDDKRLVVHGCSVGGRFTFQYTTAEPSRVMATIPMAAFDLEVPSQDSWHVPFVFYYGDHDPLYANARAAIEAMQAKMDSVELYLDAGKAHFCDPALGLEAIRAFLAE
jgi:predicted esterase